MKRQQILELKLLPEIKSLLEITQHIALEEIYFAKLKKKFSFCLVV